MNTGTTKQEKTRTAAPGVYERGIGTGNPYFQVKLRSKGQSETFRFPYVPGLPAIHEKSRLKALKDAKACKARYESLSHFYDKPVGEIYSEHRLRDWIEAWIRESCERIGLDGQPLPGMIERKGAKEDSKQIRRLMFIADAYAEKNGTASIMEKSIRSLKKSDFVGKEGLLSMLTGRAPKRANPKVPEKKPEASAATKRRALALLGMVWKHANDLWKAEDAPDYPKPWAGFEIVSSHHAKTTRALSVPELHRVEEAMKALHPTTLAAIRFLRWTAARAGEMKKLEWQHVFLPTRPGELGEVLFVGTKTPRRGAYRERRIPLPEGAEDALRSLFTGKKPEKGLVFQSPTEPTKSISRDSVYQAFVRAVNRAGVPHARLHDLRHTRTTELSKSIQPAQAMAVTGHSDPRTFMRYTHVSSEVAKQISAADKQRQKLGGPKAEAPDSLEVQLKSLSPKERKKLALQMLSDDLDND
ncbi:site-specific integrase [Stenotrophomonas maltophilia]|nr:site-specific integrase [Stenotrophomonas maltophilia]